MEFSERDANKAGSKFKDEQSSKKSSSQSITPAKQVIKIKPQQKQKKTLMIPPENSDKVSIPPKKTDGALVTIKSNDKPKAPVVVKKPVGRPLGSLKANREGKLE